MKTLKLKVIHRLLVMGYLNEEGKEPNHSLSELNKLMKLLSKVDFTDEERKVYNIRTENNSVKWNSTKDAVVGGEEVDILKDFEIEDESFDILKGILDKKNKDKKFSFEALGPIIEIAEQLGIEV